MPVNIELVVVLAIVGGICLVIAHTVPFSTPAVWVRVLLLVVGGACLVVAGVLAVVWLLAALTPAAAAAALLL